jgi:DNA-binding LacI/PurR family transcriptional regulator/anti-anti-sigma regulatory factor
MGQSDSIPTIGYITSTIYSSYHRLLLAGVQQAALERGARLLVFQMGTDDVNLSIDTWQRVDGWVISYSYGNTQPFRDTSRPTRPVVMVSEVVPGRPTVLIDNVGGMCDAVLHLIQHGHSRIALVGPHANPDYADRLVGYQKAHELHGITIDPALSFTVESAERRDGAQFAERLIASGLSYTAVAFMTDNLALGALPVFRQHGIRVPEDLAIVGFDDMPESQIATPPLTTVRMRFDAMSRAATEHLLDILGGAPPATAPIVIPASLVVRRSAGEQISFAESNQPSTPGGALSLVERLLAEIVGAPQRLAPHEPATRLWPGVATIVQLIDSIVGGGEPPDDTALQHAWLSAVRTVSYADPLDDVLIQIEREVDALLRGRPLDDPAYQRRALALRRMRVALLRVVVGGQVERINRSETALSESDRIARILADYDLEHVSRLAWLSNTEVMHSALALWEGDSTRQLMLVGRYPEQILGGPVPIQLFPPPDLAGIHGAEPIVILPLRSARRDWGFLAIVMPDDLETSAFDNSPLIAALLTARIDSATFQRERAAQEELLRHAYERERTLGDTVRELGSPIIPLSRTALLVPLIGAIDEQRAQQIITTLLRTIEHEHTREILLDVSGVPLIDTHVAGMLLRLAQMARLLGASTILIGVRPEIAQSIVSLGVDLSSLRTHASLISALETLKQPGEK